MKVGLPGVGVGGVFYLALIAIMPFRELWLTLLGRSSARRWRRVGVQLCLAGAILAGLCAEWWAMTRLPEAAAAVWRLVGPELSNHDTGGTAVAAVGSGTLVADQVSLEYLAPAIAMTPFVIIALIVAELQLLRLAMRRGLASGSLPGLAASAHYGLAGKGPGVLAGEGVAGEMLRVGSTNLGPSIAAHFRSGRDDKGLVV